MRSGQGRLRMAREDAGLRQEELATILAERYGVTVGRTYISELERNWESNKMPMSDVTAALAKALGVNGNWLLLIDDSQEMPGSAPTRGISPEGDAVAAVVDAMPQELRTFVLEFVRLAAAHLVMPAPAPAAASEPVQESAWAELAQRNRVRQTERVQP